MERTNLATEDEGPRLWRHAVVVIALVVALTFLGLRHERERYDERAVAAAEHAVTLLDVAVAQSMGAVDIGLRSLAYSLQAGGEPVRALEPGLLRQARALVPDLHAVALVDAEGVALPGSTGPVAAGGSVAGQPWFEPFRADPRLASGVVGPIVVDGGGALVFARALRGGGGTLQAVLFAVLPTESFAPLLRNAATGSRGIAVLRETATLRLVHRHPMRPGLVAGDTQVPPGFAERVRMPPRVGSYFSTSAYDAVDRAYAFRPVRGYPFLVVVGLDRGSYLADWRRTAAAAWATAALFVGGYLLATTLVWRGARRRAQAGAAVRREKERLAAILRTAADGIHLVDAQGRLVTGNPAFFRMIGVGEAAPGALSIPDWADAAAVADLDRIRQHVLATPGEVHAVDSRFRRNDGTVFDVEIRLSCLEADGSRLIVASARDVTAKRRAYAELQALLAERARLLEQLDARAAQAEAASRAKSAFLANMSHEIRTPMNAVLGLTHLLAREVEQPAQRQRLDKIDRAARHLLALLNDILDLSKIEAGRMQLDERGFALAKLLEDVRSIAGTTAEAKGLRITVDAAGAPSWIVGDETRLRQALLNYVGNAVKFTERGGIVLRVEPLQDDGSRVLLRFAVEDTGAGIAEDALPRLFQAFEQADVSSTRRAGGTGLGLAITRRFAEMMGGSVGVDSRLGVGSTFWFTAWVRRGAAPAPPASEPVPVPADDGRGRRRVLVVDDNPVNCEVAVAFLEAGGYAAEVAGDGVQAIETLGRGGFDLVLMDLQMPVLDGLEATRRLRRDPRFATLPIVAMTASAFDSEERTAREAGMDDYVTKPIVPGVFYETLARWLPPGTPAPGRG